MNRAPMDKIQACRFRAHGHGRAPRSEATCEFKTRCPYAPFSTGISIRFNQMETSTALANVQQFRGQTLRLQHLPDGAKRMRYG